MVRAASEGDVAAVAALSRQWAAEGITWGLRPDPASLLRARLAGPFFVAAEGRALLGYAYGRTLDAPDLAVFPRGARVLDVEEVFVVAGRRRQGIGGALLDALLEAGRAAGIGHFAVASASRDVAGVMRFYAAHGFRPWSVQLFRST